MASNTDAADVNEIMLGFYLAGGSWSKFVDSASAKSQLNQKTKKIGKEEAAVQSVRAEVMAQETLKWAKQNGYRGTVKKVWWTARPGVLAGAVGVDVDSRKNPTDVLVQFTNGDFLGVSAKSTKTQGDIGFKNPGIGTVEKELSINLKKIVDDATNKLIKDYGLSTNNTTRKREIRAAPKIKEDAEARGTTVLNSIREALFKKLNGKRDLRAYLIDSWMDAEELYPPYIKVTGMRDGAKVEDPLSNPKLKALSTQPVKLEKIGNDSIGVTAGGKRIMKMRAKFESQKLASSVKFSGDPWK